MNGSVAGGGFSEEVISLTRRPSGLGFNIVGGTDQQYVSNDSSIYVSRIKKDGAAHLDGRLQEGDKILAVNGKDLKDLRHKDAVELFRNAGYDVSLKIQRRLQPQNGPVGHRGDGESGGLPLAAILVPGLALAAAAVWILLRYRQRMWRVHVLDITAYFTQLWCNLKIENQRSYHRLMSKRIIAYHKAAADVLYILILLQGGWKQRGKEEGRWLCSCIEWDSSGFD